MLNMNDDLFDYLTEANNFNALCELHKTTHNLKLLLLNNLGIKIVEELNKVINHKVWSIDVVNNFENLNAEINLYNTKDNRKRFCYSILNEYSSITLCVWIDRTKFSKKEIMELFQKARDMKDEYIWKIGNEKDSSWLLYYYIENSNFNELTTFVNILPANVEYFVTNSITTDVVEDLKSSVKQLLPYLI